MLHFTKVIPIKQKLLTSVDSLSEFMRHFNTFTFSRRHVHEEIRSGLDWQEKIIILLILSIGLYFLYFLQKDLIDKHIVEPAIVHGKKVIYRIESPVLERRH